MAGQSGSTQAGTQFPTSISQVGTLYPESGEISPYPLGTQAAGGVNWPPPGYAIGTGIEVASTLLHSNLPTRLDLEWVQGDTKQLSFLVAEVNWTTVDPADTTAGVPDWSAHTWAAQIRNPYIFSTHQADHWVPAYGFQYEWWRQRSGVAEFEVSTSLERMVDPDTGAFFSPDRWATRVDLTIPAWLSERIRPGSWYRWDVQSRSVVPVAGLGEVQQDPVVETHYAGHCRVVTEWTIA